MSGTANGPGPPSATAAPPRPVSYAPPMRILITGAARAIGRATAEELIARGHDVVATARDPKLLDDLDGGRVHALDVTDDASVAGCLAAVGELDAVVNNAAIIGSGPLDDYPIEQFRKVVETNVVGALRMIQGVVPAWRSRGSGVIVNVSSVQGRVATPLEGPYAASKHALEGMSETLHYELAHFGIRVVIIEPGFIAPGMKHGDDHVGDPVYQQLWDEWSGTDAVLNGPAGRPGPELVAGAIADAIEQPDTALRVPVGADAEMIFATRAAMGDAEFEAAMRATIGLTW
jgi:NAD(P)-dependent dehydrogenase (short-subunit alcohol dehydrogenase family)